MFEAVAHLQPWVLMALILISIIACIRKNWGFASVLLPFATYHIVFTSSFIAFPAKSKTETRQTEFRVLQFNINADNPRFDDLAEAIKQTDADIFVICEANNHVMDRLADAKDRYPFHIEVGRWPNETLFNVSGTALWSKYPFVSKESLVLEKGRIQVCHAIASISGTEVSIYAAHLLAPRSELQTHVRNAGTIELAQLLIKDPHPNALLIGDLNQTVWTHSARTLLKTANMHSVLKGKMFLATWPESLFPFGIAIDHILYRGSMMCRNLYTGDGRGSDHAMLVAEMTITNTDEKSIETP